MKIIVIDIAASGGGAMSVLQDFYSYVKENDMKNEWIFLLSDYYFEETERIKIEVFPQVKKNHLKRLLFDIYRGKRIIESYHADAVLSLQNTAVFGLNIPQTLFVHQAIPFQKNYRFSFFKKNERKLAIYQYIIGTIIKLSIKKADKVIVQTEWMKNAISKQTGKNTSNIYIVQPEITLNTFKGTDNWSENNFFYPASDYLYKNIECIENAVQILNKRNIKPNVSITVNHRSCNNDINYIGHITRNDVMKYYSKCTLLFPSYIESCALPLLEARKAQTLILASDCLFSREALKGYENAYFFNPFDYKELACLMEKVINKEIIKKELEQFSIYRSENYKGWRRIVEITIETIK